jgi:murein DD-endopeptidase MepM/ murein hydrolase activator NlpD
MEVVHEFKYRVRYSVKAVLCLLALVCAFGCTSSKRNVRLKPTTGYWYTVKAGENWSSLKKQHQLNLEDIREINGLNSDVVLKSGQKIFLFGVRAPKSTSSGKVVAKRNVARPKQRTGKSRQLPPQKRKWAYPIRGARLTSLFGKRGNRPHKGIDLAAKMGTPVYATADGVVIYSGSRQRGYGNLVIVKHGSDYVSVYAHNRRNLVDEGQKVRQGFQIAELGNSGRSTGPHLHFEIRFKGKPLNPLKLIGKKP